ncbi:MAG TPA: chromate transporter [Blastocatellia bacterium]|nr:chromate transporter [Blastocatellia bacterium]
MKSLGEIREQVREVAAEVFVLPEARMDWRILWPSFLKLGATGFGGGMAVISHIRRLVVHKNRWLSEEEFLDAVSLGQSLPGANAANVIAYIGLKLAGWRGALASVAGFVLPSFLLMIGLTVAHDHLQYFTDARRVFQGFSAAVVGLIAATTIKLGQTAMKRQWHLELGAAVGFLLIFTSTSVAEVVLLAGIIGIFIHSWKSRARQRVRQRFRKQRQATARAAVAEQQARQHAAEVIARVEDLSAPYDIETSLPPTSDDGKPDPTPVAAEAGGQTTPELEGSQGNPPDVAKPHSSTRALSIAIPLILIFTPLVISKLIAVWQLVTIFLRVGSVTFGGGFVMIPQIETDVVDVQRWMSHQTFADGMAFGQITPGPVMITSTFIGYKVAGVAGAVAATIAAFLPSFLMTVVAGASLDRFRTNFQVQAFLSGIAPAVVGMLAAAGVSLARSGLSAENPLGYAIATLACLLMLRAKLNPVVIIFGCGLLQWIASRGLFG